MISHRQAMVLREHRLDSHVWTLFAQALAVDGLHDRPAPKVQIFNHSLTKFHTHRIARDAVVDPTPTTAEVPPGAPTPTGW